MTISTTTLLNSFSGNGSVVDFTYTYPINSASELLVIIKTDATGVETTKTLTSDYTVALAGDSGGTVTMGTAPASGETLFLIRNTTKTQGTDLIENDPFSAEGLEDSFDNLQMQIQEVSNAVDRSFKVSKTNSITTSEITTSAADRANKILSFDASGNLEATAFNNLDTLNEMTDVTITSVADNEVLAYDSSSSKWINQTPAEASLVSLTGSETLTNKTLTSPVINTSVSGTAVLDEDDMSSDSATKLATQQSIKAYVDSKKADMQFVLEDGDGTEVQIVKDSEVKFVEGGGIDINWTDTSTGSDADPFDLTFAIDSTVTTLTGSQTLTNKTLTSPVLNTGVSGTAIKDEDNMASDSATHLATQQSIKAYVDAVTTSLNAQDLDVSDGSSAIGIDLDTETLGILGGTGLTSSASGNNVTLSVDAAQTGITSVTNASLVLGRDADNDIDFTTDNQITFRVSANDGVVFKASGEIEAASLDISGDADIDGTLEADAITVNGTALNTVIAGVTVTNATNAVNSTHVSVADNESTNEENLIPFIEDASATGNVGLESDGDFAYNPSTGTVSATIFKGNIDAVDGDFDGTLEADSITVGGTNLTAIYSPIAGGSNIITTGALDAGSITSGFGNIDNGSSTITTTGAVSTGALSVTGASTITVADNSDNLTLKSTDADANAGPNLILQRDSGSPADGDAIGRIDFDADNDAGEVTSFFSIRAEIEDASNGTEDGQMKIDQMIAGTAVTALRFKSSETVFNDDSKDVDFRVESNNNANAIFVNGGTDSVTIGAAGTASSIAGVTFYVGQSGSIYTSDVSGTDDSAENNTAFGSGALNAITTGDNNMAFGENALGANTTGSDNIAIGLNSLDVADTESNNLAIGKDALGGSVAGGEYNVAIGNFSLDALTSGDYNVAVGYDAGTDLTTGERNTFIGHEAGKDCVGGGQNVAIGDAAGSGALSASAGRNIMIGRNAGQSMTSTTGNTLIGYEAGRAQNYDGAAYITMVGYQAGEDQTTSSYNTGFGAFNQKSSDTEQHNTSIGYYAMNGANGGGEFNTALGSYVLSNASQSGDNNVGVGYRALYVSTSGSNNTAVGYNAMVANTTGAGNVAIGKDSLKDNQTGSNNTAVGENALANTTSDQNTAVGQNALLTNTTGNSNQAIGHDSLRLNTTGNDNIAIGTDALRSNTEGTSNIAIGHEAYDAADTENHNLAIGASALGGAVAGGEYNVAVGNYTLDALTSGDNNVAVGYNAGTGITTGVANTLLGGEAGFKSTTGDGNVFVGYRAGYDDIITGNENIGVGSYSLYRLTSGASNTVVGYDAATLITTGSNNICVGMDAGVAASPSGAISTGSNTICLGNNNISDFFCADTSISSSDKRDKTDIENFNVGLEWIEKLQPVTYRWDRRTWYGDENNAFGTPDGSKKRDRLHLGFLAQDVLEVEKSFGYAEKREDMLTVNLTEDGSSYGMKYERLVTVLVNAVKELSAEVKALKGE